MSFDGGSGCASITIVKRRAEFLGNALGRDALAVQLAHAERELQGDRHAGILRLGQSTAIASAAK